MAQLTANKFIKIGIGVFVLGGLTFVLIKSKSIKNESIEESVVGEITAEEIQERPEKVFLEQEKYPLKKALKIVKKISRKPAYLAKSPDTNIVAVLDVNYSAAGEEKTCFRLSHPKNPNLHSLAGRVYFNLDSVKSWQGVPPMPQDFKLVKNIRSHLHSKEDRLKVVFDINNEQGLKYNHNFDEKKSEYCVSFQQK